MGNRSPGGLLALARELACTGQRAGAAAGGRGGVASGGGEKVGEREMLGSKMYSRAVISCTDFKLWKMEKK